MRTITSYSFNIIVLVLAFTSSANAQYGRYDRHYDRGYYGRGYYDRGYYGRGYYPRIGERVYLHRPSVYLSFGGYRYHYLDGIFYRPYGSYFEVVAPPIGIHVGVLPYGYTRLQVGPGLFYYYNGIYYRRYDDYYEVVTPPIGAELTELPPAAREIIIDHKRFYEYNGTYYKEALGDDGRVYYIVTGKNGTLSTEQEDMAYDNRVTVPQENPPHQSLPHEGQEVSSLPEGTKTVIANDQKYFVAPDGTYYQEQIQNNQVFYKVVVKPSAN